jgi:hypothetical protein
MAFRRNKTPRDDAVASESSHDNEQQQQNDDAAADDDEKKPNDDESEKFAGSEAAQYSMSENTYDCEHWLFFLFKQQYQTDCR